MKLKDLRDSKNKWDGGENKQSKICYTGIPLARHDIPKYK